jgi:hypothetical protein
MARTYATSPSPPPSPEPNHASPAHLQVRLRRSLARKQLAVQMVMLAVQVNGASQARVAGGQHIGRQPPQRLRHVLQLGGYTAAGSKQQSVTSTGCGCGCYLNCCS